MDVSKIRNFAIIAHVDHGKSTLADRLLELTGTITADKIQPQHLDRLSLERERGITIKMQPVRMRYDGFELNLIDTPGHIDFAYEVSRALAAVEGVVLLIDGTQGIQAQTLAHLELAKRMGLVIIPAINKIDLDIHDLEAIAADVMWLLNLSAESDIHLVSGKTGAGVEGLLRDVIAKVPPPTSRIPADSSADIGGPDSRKSATQALIFDSHFDSYKGIIAHIRVFGGHFAAFESLAFASNRYRFKSIEVGTFAPDLTKADQLEDGEVGYLATGIRGVGIVKIGDTVVADLSTPALPGYREPQPVIFVSIFPSTGQATEGRPFGPSQGKARPEANFEMFKENIEKLLLNDPSVRIEPTYSPTFGRGYLVGCMGLLHLEIFQERLRREFKTPIVITLPSLQYEIVLKNGEVKAIHTIEDLPSADKLLEIREPWARVQIYAPFSAVERICILIKQNRGLLLEQTREGSFIIITAELPLDELITGFFDDLKSISSGYASLTWELLGYRAADLVRLDILVAEELTPALSRITPRDHAESVGRKVIKELKELLPRGQFPIKLQAASGGRLIARETIPALKADVTGYLYGGDRTRKMKLWKKQQRGKKNLAERGKGRVQVPNDVLIKILRVK